VTKNGGGSWELINNGLPKDKWVSSVHASSHDKNVVYATLNGYRIDDFNTYVYKSSDQGKTWKSLKGNLPEVVMNIVVQDPVNPELLYLGTDHGTYISFNDGGKWELLNGLLNAASYDMKVHPRENELVIGTHGRSVFVVDVKPLQKLDINKTLTVLEPSSVRHSTRWGEKRYPYTEANIPTAVVQYYSPTAGKVNIQINKLDDKDAKNKQTILITSLENAAGFNAFSWDLKGSNYKKGKSISEASYVAKGKYELVFAKDGIESKVELEVK